MVLAAGAIHTPQILQLSGIGDPTLLSALGIETMVDLPGVGANFQDHTRISITHRCRSPNRKRVQILTHSDSEHLPHGCKFNRECNLQRRNACLVSFQTPRYISQCPSLSQINKRFQDPTQPKVLTPSPSCRYPPSPIPLHRSSYPLPN